jgi:hypothetical protein
MSNEVEFYEERKSRSDDYSDEQIQDRPEQLMNDETNELVPIQTQEVKQRPKSAARMNMTKVGIINNSNTNSKKDLAPNYPTIEHK